MHLGEVGATTAMPDGEHADGAGSVAAAAPERSASLDDTTSELLELAPSEDAACAPSASDPLAWRGPGELVSFGSGPIGVGFEECTPELEDYHAHGFASVVGRMAPGGQADASARVHLGQVVVAVGAASVRRLAYPALMELISTAPRPLRIVFCDEQELLAWLPGLGETEGTSAADAPALELVETPGAGSARPSEPAGGADAHAYTWQIAGGDGAWIDLAPVQIEDGDFPVQASATRARHAALLALDAAASAQPGVRGPRAQCWVWCFRFSFFVFRVSPKPQGLPHAVALHAF